MREKEENFRTILGVIKINYRKKLLAKLKSHRARWFFVWGIGKIFFMIIKTREMWTSSINKEYVVHIYRRMEKSLSKTFNERLIRLR